MEIVLCKRCSEAYKQGEIRRKRVYEAELERCYICGKGGFTYEIREAEQAVPKQAGIYRRVDFKWA